MPKLFLTLCFIVFFGGMNIASAADWVENEHFRSRLAPIPEGGNTAAILEIELEEGWHTYGEEPGDAGLPPRFDWAQSQNLREVKMTWPAPIHKREMDMFDVNAYEDAVAFPLEIEPENAEGEVALDLNMKIMICNQICIPDEANLSLTLTPAGTPEGSDLR